MNFYLNYVIGGNEIEDKRAALSSCEATPEFQVSITQGKLVLDAVGDLDSKLTHSFDKDVIDQ